MNQRIEPVILLLTSLVVFFAMTLIWVAVHMSMDGQTFQVVSGLVTGFSGALLMRVKPRSMADNESPEGTTTRTATAITETVTPPKP